MLLGGGIKWQPQLVNSMARGGACRGGGRATWFDVSACERQASERVGSMYAERAPSGLSRS